MAAELQTRTMAQVVEDILNHLAGIQNVLYAKSASQRELSAVWADVQILLRALEDGDEMLAAALSMNADITAQRDAAIKMVVEKRREWITFAEKQGRRVVAAGATLDKEGIDGEAVQAALDFLAGEIRGDVSERAGWDVARALERLGQELKQKGV
jgi:hypothetical protein